jgi:hypothetical protein
LRQYPETEIGPRRRFYLHPLRALRESGVTDPREFAQLLAENVIFRSALMVRAVEGREDVSRVLATASFAWSGHYVREEKLDSHTSFIYWSGSVRGHAIESMELVVDDDTGLVAENTTAFRPLPAIIPLRRKSYEALREILGPEYWSYTPDDSSTLP